MWQKFLHLDCRLESPLTGNQDFKFSYEIKFLVLCNGRQCAYLFLTLTEK